MGAWFVLRLLAEGHDVDYLLSKPEYEDVLRGLIPPPKMLSLDHRRHQLGYGFRSYKNYDLSLFDLTGRAQQADASRMETPTLGDGSFEHLLEDDREFGIKSMEECGIHVPPYTRFNTASEAKAITEKIQAIFGAVHAAQILAMVQGAAPLADELLLSSGFTDAQIPEVISKPGDLTALPAEQQNTHPNFPPSATKGVDTGIETGATA